MNHRTRSRADFFTGSELKKMSYPDLAIHLFSILAPYGKEDAFGDGNYYINVNDYGDATIYVLINQPSILRERMYADIQSALIAKFPDWAVDLTVKRPSDSRVQPQEIRITASGVDNRINPLWLKSTYGVEL